MYKLLLTICLIIGSKAETLAQKRSISDIELCTLEGKKYVFNFDEPRVVVFLSPSCPLSQKYTLTLNELATEFRGRVKFYGIFTDTDLQADDYKSFSKKYKIEFPLLLDKKRQMVKALSASVTPEAFVLTKEKLVYHGAIDDWAIELGKTKKSATINFVRNAIQCAIANTIPFPNYQKPVGCFID